MCLFPYSGTVFCNNSNHAVHSDNENEKPVADFEILCWTDSIMCEAE